MSVKEAWNDLLLKLAYGLKSEYLQNEKLLEDLAIIREALDGQDS